MKKVIGPKVFRVGLRCKFRLRGMECLNRVWNILQVPEWYCVLLVIVIWSVYIVVEALLYKFFKISR